ncbi:acyltransferase family protein [Aeromonas sp. D3]|uniref:acyltransferase family protein n=1 Tax=Aeromonas sp. D3 TaxID=2990474 RepID=UPI0022E21203|nr:acyltransferase family protein [Aeromonas sp. D3]
MLRYRADIDGLRALAVLLVVLYHANIPINGGFIGVDIFFVISGFLITSIINNEIKDKTFTFLSFYTRRVKRLVPAFFFMVLFISIYCSYYLMPEDLISYSKTVLFSLLGVSNFYFFSHTNYFESSTFEPLLHTWSLSVEEQFYLVWPMLLIAFHKTTKNNLKNAVYSLIFIGSILISWLYVNIDKNMAYMMLPFRLFELMAGAILAMNPIYTSSTSRYQNIFSIIGIILIVSSAMMLDDSSAFPGILAIPVTIGTVLLISSQGGIVNRFLSQSPVVYIGKISYSLYLWHWPIIALAKYRGIELDLINASILVVVSIATACISYHFIEVPSKKQNKPKFIIPSFYLLPVAVSAIFLYVTVETEGMKSRMNGMFDELKETNTAHVIRKECMGTMKIGNYNECYLGIKKDKPDVLMIGDSFGNAYTPFIDVLAKDAGLMVADTMRSITPSIPNVYVTQINTKPPIEQIEKVLKYTRERIEYGSTLKAVIISDYFDHYNENNSALKTYNINGNDISDKVYSMRMNAIDELVGKGVDVIILARPFKAIGREQIGKIIAMKQKHVIQSSVRYPYDGPKKAREEFRLANSRSNVTLIDPNDVLCNESGCTPFIDGDIIFRMDGTHLNYSSSQKIGIKYIKEIGNPLMQIK